LIVRRRLGVGDLATAARIHHSAQVTIPRYPAELHGPADCEAFYRDVVWREATITGAFEGMMLRGHIAVRPGWIDHLYVDPAHHGRGIGRLLLHGVLAEAAELRLWTFQSNARARAMYQRAGFVAEAFTDGENEERLPDVRYRWRRSY
jgi:GNAT superfamily N-acetyltransferase